MSNDQSSDVGRSKLPEGLEIELVSERGSAPKNSPPWRMLEIWTLNRIYAIDASMRCFDVIDRVTFRPDLSHGLLGATLVGGQRRVGGALELSHPFPLPGTEAVFEQSLQGQAARFSYSSTVSRVVLRLRQLSVEATTGGAAPWDSLVRTQPLPAVAEPADAPGSSSPPPSDAAKEPPAST
jgi:hypothetical protein